MPYRHAHYYLLLLLPFAFLAFWPRYFSDLGGAPPAFHVHGMAGTAWVLLIAFQSWTIHHRHNALHRSVGLWSALLFALFTVGGLLVIQTAGHATIAGANPFSARFGARLSTVDALSVIGVACLYYLALGSRRKVQLHARYMIATVFFLFQPILARLLTTWFPPLQTTGPDTLGRFIPVLHIANAFGVLLALFLYSREPKTGRPFLIVGGLILLQSLSFETLGRTAAWRAVLAAIVEMPTSLLVGIGLTTSVAITWFGWTRVPSGREPVPAATI